MSYEPKKKYRKKVKEVWAKRIVTNEEAIAASVWLDSQGVENTIVMGEDTALDIKDDEGIFSVPWGHYLVQSDNGAFVAIEPKWFLNHYEEV